MAKEWITVCKLERPTEKVYLRKEDIRMVEDDLTSAIIHLKNGETIPVWESAREVMQKM